MAARRLSGHCRDSGSSKLRWHGHTSFEAKPASHVLAGNGTASEGFWPIQHLPSFIVPQNKVPHMNSFFVRLSQTIPTVLRSLRAARSEGSKTAMKSVKSRIK